MSEVVRSSAPNVQHDDSELYTYLTPHEDAVDAEAVEDVSVVNGAVDAPVVPELHLTFVDQSQDARDFARDRADARLVDELGEGGRFRRIIQGIWKGNIAKDFYRQRYIREAQTEIKNSQNILTHEATHADGMRAMEATIARFQSEHDEAVHTSAGEHKEELAADSEIAASLKDLIRRYANDELDDRALLEERTRVIEAYREAHSDAPLGEGLVRIDNMLDIAQSVRGAVEHGVSLDRVLENMKIVTGESRAGVRTEAHYNMVDKAIEKLGKSRVGSLVGPETLATAVTVTASLLRIGSHKTVGALAMTVAPGIAAGLFAGLRENKRVKDERTQHAREMASGKEFAAGDRRREEMEATRYETVAANDLREAIRERFETEDGLSSDEALQAALEELTALETRIKLSDSRQIDLISYSASSAVEEERFALDIARAQAKTTLDHRLDGETRTRLGIDDTGALQDILDARSQAFIEYAEQDISDKDRAFRKLKARRVATAAATGVATGLLIGGAFQEGLAAIDDTRQGLLEQSWGAQDHPIDGEQHQTLAYGLVHGDNSHEITTHHNPSDHFESFKTGEHANISLSGDHTLVDNHDGTISLNDKNGIPTIENLPVTADGSIPQSSLDVLAQHGMIVENLSHTVDTVSTETKVVDVNQFVLNHQAETTPITRDLWYDNNTPAPTFDRNEVNLQWASGDKGEGLQANGNILMNVGSMTADGSFHGDQAALWQQQAEAGHLKLAISASESVQAEPFMVDIKADGSIDIPHDSPAAKFFGEENGHAVFNGKYAEVVQMTGKDDGGIEHVRPLATLVGNDNVGQITDTVQVHHTHVESVYKITTNGYDTHEQQTTFTEMAPVIPVVARRSLEALRSEALSTDYRSNYYGYTDGERYMSAAEAREQARIHEAETSPRLLRQPDQDLNPREELSWYRQLTRRNMGAEYVQAIDSAIAASPELSRLPANLKAIIKMPVNAAGRAESENIYDVLSAYAMQDREALDESTMLLHVNWFDDAMADAEKRQTIERTKSEIKRARAAFPQLKIATIETEWKRQEIGEDPIIGHVSRRLNDAALFAVEKAMREDNIADDQDVLLIRNDADPKGISRHYIKRYMQEADRHKETDVFTGLTTFDNTKATNTPGLVYVGNFMQSLHYFSTAREKGVHTGGANFGVRASALAAVGGIGFDKEKTGAGSDDVAIGRRIVDARTANALPYTGTGLAGYVVNWRQGRKRNGTYASTATPTKKRRIGRSVSGARIDTDSDREEALYQQGIPIIDTWNPENGFDAKGYSARDAQLGKRSKESAIFRPAELVEKIRHDMEGSLASYSPSVIRSALTFAFSRPGFEASDAYKLTTKGYDSHGRPIYNLEFTKQGREHIIRHLTRDTRGRFESYGTRKNRQMYGQVGRRARKQPVNAPLIKIA